MYVKKVIRKFEFFNKKDQICALTEFTDDNDIRRVKFALPRFGTLQLKDPNMIEDVDKFISVIRSTDHHFEGFLCESEGTGGEEYLIVFKNCHIEIHTRERVVFSDIFEYVTPEDMIN